MPSFGEGLDLTDCRWSPRWRQSYSEAFLQARGLLCIQKHSDDLWKQVSLSESLLHPLGLPTVGSHPANSLASCCQSYRHESPMRLFFHFQG